MSAPRTHGRWGDRRYDASDDLVGLWIAYKENGSSAARERLILHYLHLASVVGGVVAARMPASVDPDDLVSTGVIGLIEALERFDPARAVKFETYASPRVRGAMLDEMRALDWVPRAVRAQATALDRVTERLQAELGRQPTRDELAAALALDADELDDLLAGTARMHIMLESVLTDGSDAAVDANKLDAIADERADVAGDDLEALETRRTLLEAVANLEERERTMITLYYFEGYTLSRIGKVFGVSESRVSQIHARALAELRGVEHVLACGESYGWTPKADTVELDRARKARRRRPLPKSA